MESNQNATILKQMEYYLSDTNLAKDDFFRKLIAEDKKTGYIKLEVFQNCNAIKKLKISNKEIVEACKDSKEIEFSKDNTKVRRVGNKALPEQTGSLRKRDSKAASKQQSLVPEETKEEDFEEAVERDEKGRIIFVVKDFENTHIIHFSTKDRDEKKDEDYKVNWKNIEDMIKAKFDMLKVVYTRADKYEGDLAISSHRMNKK